MSQAYRDQVREAKRRRQHYLDDKGEAHTRIFVGILAAVIFGLLAFGMVYIATLPHSCYPTPCRPSAVTLTLAGLCALLPGTLALTGVFLTFAGVKESIALPYVPPVREDIGSLPAEEILVRGSEQPAAAPEEMLRAAESGAIAPEELLRHT